MRARKVLDEEYYNSLLGKKVRITLFNGTSRVGILKKSSYCKGYNVGNLHFQRNHVINLKEL